jgi:hypothetical protein
MSIALSAPPCYECGATQGHVRPDRKTPRRVDGQRFGLPGLLCNTCYERYRTRSIAANFADRLDLCELCGQPPHGPRYDGSGLDIEGMICGQCREELLDEIALARHQRMVNLRYRSPASCDGRLYAGQHSYRLAILNPRFTANDLTPKAACRLLIIEMKRRERRASA